MLKNLVQKLLATRQDDRLPPNLQGTVVEVPESGQWAWRIYLDQDGRELELATGTAPDEVTARSEMAVEFQLEAKRRGGVTRFASARVGGGVRLVGMRSEGRIEFQLFSASGWAREPVSILHWILCSTHSDDVFLYREGAEAFLVAGEAKIPVRCTDAESFAKALQLHYETESGVASVPL